MRFEISLKNKENEIQLVTFAQATSKWELIESDAFKLNLKSCKSYAPLCHLVATNAKASAPFP